MNIFFLFSTSGSQQNHKARTGRMEKGNSILEIMFELNYYFLIFFYIYLCVFKRLT